MALNDNVKVLTHGDLHPGNVVFDGNVITGVLDWGQSGFSIREREYFEARSRTRDVDWMALLDTIFQSDFTSEPYTLFSGLERAS